MTGQIAHACTCRNNGIAEGALAKVLPASDRGSSSSTDRFSSPDLSFLTLVHREVASISSMPKKAESEIADFLQKLAPNLEARYAASFARVVELLSS